MQLRFVYALLETRRLHVTAAAVLLTEADVFIDAAALLRVVRRTAQRAGGRVCPSLA